MESKQTNEFIENQEKQISSLAQFNSDFKMKEWCFEKTIYIEDFEDYKFYNRTIYHENYNVPINKVIGTNHFSYINRRWIDLLGNMKKSKSFWNKENFLEFSKTAEFLNEYRYAKFGDSYFVTDGNHRNCEAKFCELKSVRTPVSEYILDIDMLKNWRFLNEEGFLPIIEDGHNRTYYRTFKWTLIINQERIIFRDFEAIKKFTAHYKKMKITTKELFSFFLQNKGLFLRIIETYYSVSDDYNQLNRLIHKHKNNFNSKKFICLDSKI
ncbi:hypothetical protein [Flavobacterium tructae]|uniref:hypothetical protein n=1 Tax=Flavobacterium tructae TaxID=1114873 RepID=UPI0035A91ADF